MRKKKQTGRLWGALLILALAACVMTSGCQSRDPGSSKAGEAPEQQSAPEESVSVPEEPKEPEIEYIIEPEPVAQAKEIIFGLLDRAEEANELYRGSVQRDNSMVIDMDGIDYLLVLDERFATYDDLLDFWQKTFVSNGIAAERYEVMRLNRVYTSINGQLHVMQEISPSPMTLGLWDRSSFMLVRFDDDHIEAEMATSLVGQPGGEKILSVVKRDGVWLLDDSYFLD